ncbi:MAG: HAMP domain-containing protein, partial [Dehalococcoidia bacterium]
MRNWLFSLQFRLIVGFTIVLVLALTSVSLYVGNAAQEEVEILEEGRREFRAARLRRMISRSYALHQEWSALQPALEQAGSLYDRRIVVTDGDGRIVADSHQNQGDPWPDAQQKPRLVPIVVNNAPVGYLAYAPEDPPPSRQRPPGDVRFPNRGEREPAVSRLASQVKRSLLWTGLASIAGGILLVSLMSRRILAPIQILSGAARQLGQGDLSQRVPVAGPSEVGHLGSTFNSMAANLEQAEQQRRNLVADVAHELRTPLSNI